MTTSDRLIFFKTQIVFWMLCAIDGHAKNFSVFVEPRGRFALTPLYDILSAYPVLGPAAKQLAPQKVKMAMAVTGKNQHYKWAEIQPRHLLTTAADCGLETNARQEIIELATQATAVAEKVARVLPAGFPEHVSKPIFDGLLKAAQRLLALGYVGTTDTCETTATKLARIAKLSASDPLKRFDSLVHLFNEESLAACCHAPDGKKAVGIECR